MKAPWVKTFFYGDDCTYIIPGVDHVTLGLTSQFDDYSLEPRVHDFKGIWERCCAMVPSLKRAEVSRQFPLLEAFTELGSARPCAKAVD